MNGSIVLTLATALLSTCTGGSSAPPAAIWHTDIDEALVLARTQHAPGVMVQTTAAWCHPCKEFDRDLESPALQRALASWVLVRVDLTRDSDTADALAGRWHLGTPTVLFLDPDGRELERLDRYVPPATLTARIPVRP